MRRSKADNNNVNSPNANSLRNKLTDYVKRMINN